MDRIGLLANRILSPPYLIPAAIAILLLLWLMGCARADTMPTGAPVVPPPAYTRIVAGLPVKDCNEFARENYIRLRSEGLRPFFIAAWDERGEGHMMVGADIGGETLVWDNRLPGGGPVDWRALPYRWYGREVGGFLWDAITERRRK